MPSTSVTDHSKAIALSIDQFKLAIAVKAAAHHGQLPQQVVAMQFGGIALTKEDLELDSKSMMVASSALEHTATFVMAIAIDTAFEKIFGRIDFSKDVPKIHVHERRIARAIRNAFAHNPFDPIWKCKAAEEQAAFSVDKVISLDTTKLNGKKVKWQHYGGPLALMRFAEHAKMLVS